MVGVHAVSTEKGIVRNRPSLSCYTPKWREVEDTLEFRVSQLYKIEEAGYSDPKRAGQIYGECLFALLLHPCSIQTMIFYYFFFWRFSSFFISSWHTDKLLHYQFLDY